MGVNIGVTILISLIRIIVTLYDIITIPLYYYIQKPWKKLERAASQHGRQLDPTNPYSPWVRTNQHEKNLMQGCDNVTQFFDRVVSTYGDKKAFGFRPILEESSDVQANGRIFKKYVLGDYQWNNYYEMQERVKNVASGFLQQGIKHGDIVMIMADTRLEWMLSALALMKVGATVSTLYAILGEDGIAHGINETEVTHIVTSQDMLPKLLKILPRIPLIRNIVYMEGFSKVIKEQFPEEIKVTPFLKLEEMGKMVPFPSTYPKSQPNDTAILMYTSGSTGIPKGVMLSHRNVLASAAAYTVISPHLSKQDSYLAYLPLAHVLEMASEFYFMSLGMAIGYGSPLTMTDKSTGIKKGCPGDFSVLKPTIATGVPLVLDRIRKGVCEEIDGKGAFAKQLFDFVIKYKRHWTKQGYRTPIVNFLVCNKIKQILGGRLRMMAVGGAPLGPETHEFIDACLDIQVLQGYGLTECAASGTLMNVDELSSGRVGAPLAGVSIKLIDWVEGNYRVTDKPNPRGEIIIGGPNISKGYYKNDQLTKESYFDEDGTRWFYTGDIAEMYPNGTVKIVDRRKDLVKLQFGEYISLGKVESELKCSTYVDNICVIGDSYHDHLIALIVPNVKALKQLAQTVNKEHMSYNDLCRDLEITNLITKDIVTFSSKQGLNKMEIPTKIKLCSEEWLPDTGLVTAALKIRRKNIHDYYKSEIRNMYGGIDATVMGKSS